MRRVLLKWGGPLAIFAAAAFLLFALRIPQGFSALREKHQQIRQLQKDNAGLARENELKRERIRKLRDSRSEQELEIRKRLKLQREGETSIILPSEKAPGK